tara:strand:- start:363 stop:1451 length:1089 start_codon:yes stop_codon:yes gene_type:complete
MPAENIYRIKQGDTLIDLFGQNWQEVAASNGIEDPTKLQIGQEIDLNLYDYSIVPQGQEQQVQQEQPSGEDAFKFDAADWASSYFKEGDTGDVYADLSPNVGSIGNDVFSSFSDNSFMPEAQPQPALVGAPAETATTETPAPVEEDLFKPIVDQYAENLKEYEGNYRNTSFAHKPTGGSGVTVAQGLDSAWETREDMEAVGVPARVLDYMESIGAWTAGTAAVLTDDRFLPENRMNETEFDIVSTNLANRSRDDGIKFKEDYPNLNNKGISILMSLKHWGGGWNSNSETKLTRYSDNINTGNAVTTGTLVSPVKEALSNPDVTNEDLIAALDTTRKSYVPWGDGKETFRYKTLSKYIKRLEE